MTTHTRPRAWIVRSLALSAAIAAAAVTGPLAASAASAVEGAPIDASPMGSTDADAEAALHVGVRQASVGDPVPVTVVGAQEGAVWEIALVSPETALGTLTIGADGTGTTLVALPVGTSSGSIEIAASTPGAALSAVLSSAGDPAAPASPSETRAGSARTESEAGMPSGVLLAGGAVLATAVAATSVVVAARRRAAR
ncbi:MAG TPA: hypothetical protein VFY91_10840 [Microbacterium sp.]|nr:hypothetical protein [Microbacterium sp.]